MKIADIEKKMELVNKVKEFDEIIMKLGKMANQIDNEKGNIKIKMSIDSPIKEEYKDNYDPNSIRISWIPISYSCDSNRAIAVSDELELNISDLFSYEIFAIVYRRTLEERDKLIKKIND